MKIYAILFFMVICAASVTKTTEKILTDQDILAGFERAKRDGLQSVIDAFPDSQDLETQLKYFFDIHCLKCQNSVDFLGCLGPIMLKTIQKQEYTLRAAGNKIALEEFDNFCILSRYIIDAARDQTLKPNTQFRKLIRPAPKKRS